MANVNNGDHKLEDYEQEVRMLKQCLERIDHLWNEFVIKVSHTVNCWWKQHT